MSIAKQQALKIIESISNGQSVQFAKAEYSSTNDEWYRYGSKAYNIILQKQKTEANRLKKKRHVSSTTNEEIGEILLKPSLF